MKTTLIILASALALCGCAKKDKTVEKLENRIAFLEAQMEGITNQLPGLLKDQEETLRMALEIKQSQQTETESLDYMRTNTMPFLTAIAEHIADTNIHRQPIKGTWTYPVASTSAKAVAQPSRTLTPAI